MIIKGGNKLTPAKVNAHKDHRIAMALSIAALAIEGESEVIDSHWVNISYPDFYDIILQFKNIFDFSWTKLYNYIDNIKQWGFRYENNYL